MNVLSLFDGMSGGQQALHELGIKYKHYFASEIEDSSIKITQKNFPYTVQIGSVVGVNYKDNVLWSGAKKIFEGKIDLLIGGFPCTSVSRAVINSEHYTGLASGQSSLFYELARLIKEVQPKYFLVENVTGMTDEDKDIISEFLKVEPIKINSDIFTAQSRERYYWTNIPQSPLPVSKGLKLKDVILSHDKIPEKYWYKQTHEFHGYNTKPCATLHVNGHDILKRVYCENQVAPTLTACRGGYKQKKLYQNNQVRKLLPIEYERLQGFPDDYTRGVADSNRYNMLGDGWTVPVIKHLLQNLKGE